MNDAHPIGLSIRNGVKVYPGTRALKGVDFDLRMGAVNVLVGENGAGKSTFLRAISGEIDPTTGNITQGPGERMSVLKQDHFAFDEFTVIDTVMKGHERLWETEWDWQSWRLWRRQADEWRR